MPLVLVTGIPGSGKSAVLGELRLRGYEAYGADEDNWARWEDRTTREVVALSTTAEMRTAQWRADNEWYASRVTVEALAQEAKTRLIFLCGFVANEDEIWDLFSFHICLSVDESNLRQRVVSRTDNDFGKSAAEFSEILEMRARVEDRYRRRNVTMLDASKPLKNVVTELLAGVSGLQL